MKGKALIPNLITAGNLLGGVLAIIFALTGRLEWAPYCIFISAILDFLDGFAARLLKVQSELGKQLDSLADMVTFGVAPGIIVYQLIKLSLLNQYAGGITNGFGQFAIDKLDPSIMERLITEKQNPRYWGMPSEMIPDQNLYLMLPFIAFIIPVMSLFRLAKFNLDTRQTDSFIGVPTPANTLFFVSFPLIIFQALLSGPAWQINLIDWIFLNPWFLAISAVIMSILLVSEIPLFALKFKSFGWKGNEIRYIFLTLCAVLLATLQWLALPLIIILYILLSIFQNLRLRQKATTNKFANNEKIQS